MTGEIMNWDYTFMLKTQKELNDILRRVRNKGFNSKNNFIRKLYRCIDDEDIQNIKVFFHCFFNQDVILINNVLEESIIDILYDTADNEGQFDLLINVEGMLEDLYMFNGIELTLDLY